jgi:glucose/arabinose dehydrogenase
MEYFMRRLSRGLVAAALAATGLVSTMTAAPVSVFAATVPGGFTDVAVASVSNPTSIEYLSDGVAVVLEQDGKVRLLQNGALLPGAALSLNVCGGGGTEMGLLGFAADQNYAVTGWVYIYATRPVTGGCVNRVSRFTMSGGTIDPNSETILLDNLPGTVTESAGNHNGGDIEIASDGYLYVAVGDSGRDPRNDSGGAGGNDAAQDLSILSGKIVRIRTDGGIPADNPFQGAGTARCATAGIGTPTNLKCQEIFAYGLRNPYRFAFDPNAGGARFFINDVGQDTREEVNLGIKGANYGWNGREGQCPAGQNPPCAGPPSGVTDPVTDYGHDIGCPYITAGAVVPNGLWPAKYDGAYLFADGGCGRMWARLADGSVDYVNPFATGLGQVAHMAFLPDGNGTSLFYTNNGADQLRKITYTGLGAAPTASGLRMTPVAPDRVYDTRNAIGVTTGAVVAGSSRVIKLDRYPDAKAVLVNVTMADAQGTGFVQSWPTRTQRPTTSSINSSGGGDVVANASILPVNEGSIVLSTSVTTNLIVDVLGWYGTSSSTGGEFRALAPSRLIDSRQPTGTTNPYTVVGDHIDIQVTGNKGIPSDGSVGAVAFILTGLATASGASGYVTAYPTGQIRPDASNVNTTRSGDIRANLVIVPVGAGGKVSLFGFNTEDMLVDVAGWVTAASVPLSGSGQLNVTGSIRAFDSRSTASGKINPSTGFSLDTAGVVPPTASAVIHNITVTGTGGWGFVTARPNDGSASDVSNVNYVDANQTRAALAVTSLVPGKRQVLFSTYAPTHLIVDVYGWFS